MMLNLSQTAQKSAFFAPLQKNDTIKKPLGTKMHKGLMPVVVSLFILKEVGDRGIKLN